TVRPWGFWKPIDQLVKNETPGFRANRNFAGDMWKVTVGIVAQMCLTLIPFYLILKMYVGLGIACFVLAVSVVILKTTWWDKLSDEESGESSMEPDAISLTENNTKKIYSLMQTKFHERLKAIRVRHSEIVYLKNSIV